MKEERSFPIGFLVAGLVLLGGSAILLSSGAFQAGAAKSAKTSAEQPKLIGERFTVRLEPGPPREIQAPVAMTISKWKVELGDSVTSGQELADLALSIELPSGEKQGNESKTTIIPKFPRLQAIPPAKSDASALNTTAGDDPTQSAQRAAIERRLAALPEIRNRDIERSRTKVARADSDLQRFRRVDAPEELQNAQEELRAAEEAIPKAEADLARAIEAEESGFALDKSRLVAEKAIESAKDRRANAAAALEALSGRQAAREARLVRSLEAARSDLKLARKDDAEEKRLRSELMALNTAPSTTSRTSALPVPKSDSQGFSVPPPRLDGEISGIPSSVRNEALVPLSPLGFGGTPADKDPMNAEGEGPGRPPTAPFAGSVLKLGEPGLYKRGETIALLRPTGLTLATIRTDKPLVIGTRLRGQGGIVGRVVQRLDTNRYAVEVVGGRVGQQIDLTIVGEG